MKRGVCLPYLAFYARNLSVSKEMAMNLQSFRSMR